MIMKITKKQRTEFVKNKLATNEKWALHALQEIFKLQTNDEQEDGYTRYHNNVGFTGNDAEILTSFARFYNKAGFLTGKQMALLYKRIKKYHRQVIMLSDKDRLDGMIIKANLKHKL